MTQRPQNFDQFVGQPKVVEELTLAVDSARARDDIMDHVLLSGSAGRGKTTIAKIIAGMFQSNVTEIIGNALRTPQDVAGTLTRLRRGDVFFIDEIHAVPIKVQEYLYTAMEDYAITSVVGAARRNVSVDLQKFILVGATTMEGLLTQPMRDRFGHVCRLVPYSNKEMMTIIQRAATSEGLEISTGALEIMADRTRATPRVALRQLRRVRDVAAVRGQSKATVDTALETYRMMGIGQYGLNGEDVSVLRALAKRSGRSVGLDYLQALTDISKHTIAADIEPHLARLGFIERLPRGRQITDEGMAAVEKFDGHS